MILRSVFDALASVLFPAPCRICSLALTTASRIPICESCLNEFDRTVDPMCDCCGRPLASASAATPGAETVSAPASALEPAAIRCRLCRTNFYAFERARSFAVYDRALSEAILLLKYERVASLADWFGERLAQIVIDAGVERRADIVVPVPLHRDRRRERGYNQAELIARPVAKHLRLRLDANLLMRTKPRPPQLVLSRTEHWRSVRGAYAIRDGMKIDKLRVLLVDDVLTTGATLDSCSRALKKAGASAVFGLTVGRVRSGTATPATPPAVQGKRTNPDSRGKHL